MQLSMLGKIEEQAKLFDPPPERGDVMQVSLEGETQIPLLTEDGWRVVGFDSSWNCYSRKTQQYAVYQFEA